MTILKKEMGPSARSGHSSQKVGKLRWEAPKILVPELKKESVKIPQNC